MELHDVFRRAMKRWIALAALLAAAVSGIWAYRVRSYHGAVPTSGAAGPQPAYAGAATCRECHAAEYAAWDSSQHSRAMQVADASSVLGDFDNARFAHGGVTSTFSRRDGTFWVRTDGADGALHDFEVKYTFGVSPLQQYLISLPGGRLQALSIAWDTRPKSAGGQRWFHLYPGETIDHTDELHWTGRQQNWNFTCADCHSTNVRKGYDAARDSFQTTWSEINVACEACHGPGSRHLAWARAPGPRSNDNGLTVHLSERRGVRWIVGADTLQPRRSEPRRTDIEIEVCAPCHSRRGQIAEGYVAGARFEDYYVPELIMPGLYHADGQQRDEVYIYGSFLQSRMAAAAGVTCADCHEPHSQRLRAPGNALCGQCHAPAKYDSPAHHFHRAQTAGAQCVSCHMPQATYMVIDARRDHSFRIPRPDRSVRLGVPDPCTGCHRDRGPKWASDQIRARTGRPPSGFQTFAEAFDAAERNEPGSADGLSRVADDAAQPAIVRASALARLAGLPTTVAVETARRHLGDPDPSVRRAALMALDALPLESRRGPGAPLLGDPVRTVRLQAAWFLAPAAATLAGSADQNAFARAADEFIASRRYRADRPEDRTTLGFFLAQLGRRDEATAEYRAALRLSPRYTPAYVNLSDLQREQGLEGEAERTLRDGLAVLPADAALHHALGLSLARSGRRSDAVRELKRATELSTETRFTYAYAVALHSAGSEREAIDVLERTRTRAPRDHDVLFALATFHRDAGRIARALQYAEALQAAYPDDQDARRLVESLRASLPPHRPQ